MFEKNLAIQKQSNLGGIVMTLVDASDKITPILKSGLLGTNKELDEAMKVVEGYLNGYEVKTPSNSISLKSLIRKLKKQ